MTARPPWTDKYKHNWDDAHQRMMAWWQGEGLDRPVALTPARKAGAPEFSPSRDPGEKEARDLDETWCLEWSRHQLAWHLFPAEAPACVRTRYDSALCMVARMAGARVRFTPDTGTAWIQEEPRLYDRPLPEFDPQCPPYAHAVKMIHRHAEAFGYDCIIGTDDLLDPLTTLSMMRSPGQLCLDLMERPETVERWRERLGDLFLQIAAGFRQARAEHGRREQVNWTGTWASGDIEALQCDFSTMLSPAMFRRFAMPELERQLEFYDYALWHLDGAAEIRHLDDLLSLPRLRAIQWVDDKRLGPLHWLELFRRIRSKGRSVMFACGDSDQAVEVTRRLGKDGLAFQFAPALSESEMERLLKRLRAV